jgi:hypothetical protein
MRLTFVGIVGLAATLGLLLAGCSTHNTTLRQESSDGQVIYRISEEQAFTVVLRAYADVLPKQGLYEIADGARRGYESTWRVWLDSYSQKVFVIPAVGTDAEGREVHGYWFDVSGAGTAGISGGIKNRDLYEHIQRELDATGAATIVRNLREGRYETDGRAYRAGGRDARDVISPWR